MKKEIAIQELYKHFTKERVDTVMSAKKYSKMGPRIPKGQYEKYVNIPLCCDLYTQYNIPIVKLAMLFGTSDVSLREHMIATGVELKGHKGYDYNNNYFEHIDTVDKAYFLGLFMADGSLSQKNNEYTVSIALNLEDGYVIDTFTEKAQINIKPKISVRYRDGYKKETYYLSLRSSQMFSDLYKWNVLPNKSLLGSCKMPNIDENLKNHFIRGYYDGNGIAFKNGKIGFCGSETLMYDIRNKLIENCNVTNVKVTYNKQNHIYYVVWSERYSVSEIIRYMYNEAGNLFLTRKRDKVIEGLRARNVVIR